MSAKDVKDSLKNGFKADDGELICPPIKIEPWSDFDQVLRQLAEHCLKNNCFRQGNKFYGFSRALCRDITVQGKMKKGHRITGGYFFLDDPNGKVGLIRIVDNKDCDPKWSFEMKEDGTIDLEVS